MTQNTKEKPDAFKAVMAAARAELGRPDLAHQSLGRDLSPSEQTLADALMEIYAAGASGSDEVAAALSEKSVPSPRTGSTVWTAESIARELAVLNADLDMAYEENGFGG